VTGPDPGDKPRPREPDPDAVQVEPDPDTVQVEPDPDAVQVVSYLWQEYQYRHDMVWQLAFRITAVAAALLIAPFLADVSVQKAVGGGLAGLPLLAIVVLVGGLFMLQSELPRLEKIRKTYREKQDKVLWPEQTPTKRHKLEFDQRVLLYFVVLLVLTIIYVVFLLGSWLPALIDEARKPQ
jgi:hypothetical protein